MKVRVLFPYFHFILGIFYDDANRTLYMGVPGLMIVVYFKKRLPTEPLMVLPSPT